MSVSWFCWDGVPSPPHPSREALASTKEPLCPGQSWARSHVPGVAFYSYPLTRAGISSSRGTQARSIASRDWGRAKGVWDSWDLGLSRCGCGVVRGIRTRCPVLLCKAHAGPVLLGLWVSQRPGQSSDRPCFREPGGQEEALLTNLTSQDSDCAVQAWAELHNLPVCEKHKSPRSLLLSVTRLSSAPSLHIFFFSTIITHFHPCSLPLHLEDASGLRRPQAHAHLTMKGLCLRTRLRPEEAGSFPKNPQIQRLSTGPHFPQGSHGLLGGGACERGPGGPRSWPHICCPVAPPQPSPGTLPMGALGLFWKDTQGYFQEDQR